MADKKYYWLKLHKDFFKRHEIRVIEEMPNGKDYILFYLKLLVESITHEGKLRFSDAIPYNEQMLSSITNTNIDTVKNAMDIFIQLNMIEVLDDATIFMKEVEDMVGSESASAIRKRKSRENQALLNGKCDIVTDVSQESHTMSGQCPIEIRDKSIENRDKNISTISKDIVCQTETVRPDTKPIIEAWNSLSKISAIKPITKLSTSSKRYQSLIARLKDYSVEDILKAIENIKCSEFLKGNNRRNWIITFDWFVKPNNFPKVLENQYANYQSSNGYDY